ncbi:MAG TPA: hypothetical protein VN457_06505, partial [Chlamydiales bacterium]|nr:hypothetical protein [Chlamydiales bacterium]
MSASESLSLAQFFSTRDAGTGYRSNAQTGVVEEYEYRVPVQIPDATALVVPPRFLNERSVQLFVQEAAKGDVTRLLKWMDRFNDYHLYSFLHQFPKVAATFADV